MSKRLKYYSMLAIYLLVMSFQFFGNQSNLCASSSFNEDIVATISHEFSVNNHATQKRGEVHSQFPYLLELLAEVSEEDTEKIKTAPLVSNRFVSQQIFLSFLHFPPTDIINSVFDFDTANIVSSTAMFIKFSVYRL